MDTPTIPAEVLLRLNSILCRVPLSITRWLSTPAHNQAVGGAPESAHLRGLAVDLVADSNDNLLLAARAARDAGFKGIEVDLRNNHLHVDLQDRPAPWQVVIHADGHEAPLVTLLPPVTLA